MGLVIPFIFANLKIDKAVSLIVTDIYCERAGCFVIMFLFDLTMAPRPQSMLLY